MKARIIIHQFHYASTKKEIENKPKSKKALFNAAGVLYKKIARCPPGFRREKAPVPKALFVCLTATPLCGKIFLIINSTFDLL